MAAKILLTIIFAVSVSAASLAATATKASRGLLPRASPCVDGTPASLPSQGSWGINYAAVAPNATVGANYTLAGDWFAAHHISTTSMGFGPDNALYAAFQCQYVCNGKPGCVAYFGDFSNAGNGAAQYRCMLLDELLSPALYVADSAAMPGGGYNRLCNPPASSP